MKINWKGTIATLVVSASVIGGSVYLNHTYDNQSKPVSHVQTASTKVSSTDTIADDNSSDITIAPYDGTDKIKIVSDSNGFVDDSYMQDKPKQEEIKVGDPYQKVLQVMGEPDHKTVTKYADGTSELWEYSDEYIFLDSGWVESITK